MCHWLASGDLASGRSTKLDVDNIFLARRGPLVRFSILTPPQLQSPASSAIKIGSSSSPARATHRQSIQKGADKQRHWLCKKAASNGSHLEKVSPLRTGKPVAPERSRCPTKLLGSSFAGSTWPIMFPPMNVPPSALLISARASFTRLFSSARAFRATPPSRSFGCFALVLVVAFVAAVASAGWHWRVASA